jgi:hypothetical protein
LIEIESGMIHTSKWHQAMLPPKMPLLTSNPKTFPRMV